MAALMLQGTGSDVGKSVLVAGLCRAFANRGLTVRPFKPQNMSNNAAVTADGGEIGRAQALQAMACRTAPTVDMNPVLLKPQSDRGSQLIVHGQVRGIIGSNFREARRPLLNEVLASFARLRAEADLVVVEGAGSPAEINLRAGDIANMGFARAAEVPVVLVGDIDRGGVIAAVAGTRAVLDPDDAAMIRGFLINKFRGDPTLFDDGYRAIERLSGWRGFGVVPWLAPAARLPSEDAVALERPTSASNEDRIVVACPMLPRIANFDDLDPLKLEPGIELVMVPPGRAIPANATLVILPGTKATIADLAFVRAQGWDIDILAHHRRGGRILGLCGGYQMLGRSIADPERLESRTPYIEGLGLLDVDTVLHPDKALRPVTGQLLPEGARFSGYEMHMGVSTGDGTARPLVRLDDGRSDGSVSTDGRVAGTYVHGIFTDQTFRAAWLARMNVVSSGRDHDASVDQALDEIAAILEEHLDVGGLLALARS